MNAVERVERHGQSVKRFRSLCDMHRVPFGSSENLEDLLRSLKEDRHFAMDFWALVGDMSAREHGALNDREMLDVIVEGSTSLLAAELPEHAAGHAHELQQLLSGVDVSAPAELPDPISRPEDMLLGSARKGRRATAVVPLPERAPRANAAPPVQAQGDDAWGARRSIGEALSRIEQTSMELREQLAAIEEQIELDRLIKEETAAGVEELSAASAASEVADEIPVDLPSPRTMPQREVASPFLAPAEREESPRVSAPKIPVVPHAELEGEPEILTRRPARTLSQRGLAYAPEERPSEPTPLSRYVEEEEEGGGRRLAVRTALLLVLAAGGLFLFARTQSGQAMIDRYRPAIRAQYDDFVQRLGILKREATKKQDNSADETAAAALPAAGASDSPTPQPAAKAPQPNTALQPTTKPVEQPDSSSGASRRDREAKERSRTSDVAPEPVGQDLVEDSSAVRVSPSVMDANLIASRVPAYPETARSAGIEGPVVMEAVISKYGTVDHVRVVEGDRRLRSAAEEAVLKWRYRPYVVNGRPVDVATMVRVDFRLHPVIDYRPLR